MKHFTPLQVLALCRWIDENDFLTFSKCQKSLLLALLNKITAANATMTTPGCCKHAIVFMAQLRCLQVGYDRILSKRPLDVHWILCSFILTMRWLQRNGHLPEDNWKAPSVLQSFESTIGHVHCRYLLSHCINDTVFVWCWTTILGVRLVVRFPNGDILVATVGADGSVTDCVSRRLLWTASLWSIWRKFFQEMAVKQVERLVGEWSDFKIWEICTSQWPARQPSWHNWCLITSYSTQDAFTSIYF